MSVAYYKIRDQYFLDAAEEVWSFLQTFEFQARCAFYEEWETISFNDGNRFPVLIYPKRFTQKRIKGILNRITKDNTRQYGKLLAKFAHCNPTLTFATVLRQIQSYDNMINAVVEGCKYMTPLGFDALVCKFFCDV